MEGEYNAFLNRCVGIMNKLTKDEIKDLEFYFTIPRR